MADRAADSRTPLFSILEWAPSGVSFNAAAVALGEQFLERIPGKKKTIGEGARESLQIYLKSAGEEADYLPYLFTLQGDPALQLGPSDSD